MTINPKLLSHAQLLISVYPRLHDTIIWCFIFDGAVGKNSCHVKKEIRARGKIYGCHTQSQLLTLPNNFVTFAQEVFVCIENAGRGKLI